MGSVNLKTGETTSDRSKAKGISAKNCDAREKNNLFGLSERLGGPKRIHLKEKRNDQPKKNWWFKKKQRKKGLEPQEHGPSKTEDRTSTHFLVL